jgi:hypothetical protein
MSTFWKWLFVCVTGILLIVLFFDQIKIRQITKDKDILNIKLMSVNDTATAYKTKAGEAYYRINSVTIENNALKGSLEAMGIDQKKLKETNINLSNIVSVLREELKVSGHTGSIPLVPVVNLPSDTSKIKAKSFEWTNTFLTLKGITEDARIRNIDYKYQTGILHTTEDVKDKTIVTISLTDKENASIINGSQFVVTPTKHWWNKPWVWGVAGAVGGILIAK